MLIKESLFLKDLIESLNLPSGSTVLNFGAQSKKYVSNQPYIGKNIYRTIKLKKWNIINFDIIEEEGIDISGDIFNDDVFRKLISFDFKLILLCNILEHVTNIKLFAERISNVLQPGGHLLVSVPYKYPIHNDPIDNGFRPTPEQISLLFPCFQTIQSSIVEDYTLSYYLLRNPKRLLKYLGRLVTPFYRFENWKTQIAQIPFLFKRYKVSVSLLQKEKF